MGLLGYGFEVMYADTKVERAQGSIGRGAIPHNETSICLVVPLRTWMELE